MEKTLERAGLRGTIRRLFLDMFSLRYLLDIQVEMLNRQLDKWVWSSRKGLSSGINLGAINVHMLKPRDWLRRLPREWVYFEKGEGSRTESCEEDTWRSRRWRESYRRFWRRSSQWSQRKTKTVWYGQTKWRKCFKKDRVIYCTKCYY